MFTSLMQRARPAAIAACVILLGLSALPITAPAQQASPGTVAVRIETSLGTILAEIDSVRAPISARNFLRYVDSSAYTGGRFHRTVTMDNQPRDTVRIEVIQGGANPSPTRTRFPAIPLERTNTTGLKHRDGTLSMARGGPDSATSDFFICVGDQPSLDFAGHRNLDGQGFAAFGQVTQGMDIVRVIQKRPADGQSLKPPIEIVRIERVRR